MHTKKEILESYKSHGGNIEAFANAMATIEGIDASSGRDYLVVHLQRYLSSFEMLPDLPAGAGCLDIGVSPFSRGLQVMFGLKVSCLDHHALWATACRTATPPIDLEIGDLNNLVNHSPPTTIGKGNYQLITFLEVIEHLGIPPVEVLRFLHHQLAPGGYLLLGTPNLVRLMSRIRFLMGNPPIKPLRRYGEGSLSHVREYTMSEINEAVQEAGFTVERARYSTAPSRTIKGRIYDAMAALHPSFGGCIEVLARRN